MRRVGQLADEDRANRPNHDAAHAKEQSSGDKRTDIDNGSAYGDPDEAQDRTKQQADTSAEAVRYTRDKNDAGNVTNPV